VYDNANFRDLVDQEKELDRSAVLDYCI
jgi:hypothetical protein